MKDSVKNMSIVILVGVVIYLFVALMKSKDNIKIEYRKVEVPKEIEKIQKVEIPIEKIKIIPKEKIKYKYVPKEIIKDNNKEVTAVGVEKCPDGSKVIITTTIDKATKESDIYTRIEPKPFFQFLPGGEVGFKYGFQIDKSFGIGPEISAYGRYDIFRLKDFYVGVGAEIGIDNKAYIYGRINF